jgi:hypothetical protein
MRLSMTGLAEPLLSRLGLNIRNEADRDENENNDLTRPPQPELFCPGERERHVRDNSLGV